MAVPALTALLLACATCAQAEERPADTAPPGPAPAAAAPTEGDGAATAPPTSSQDLLVTGKKDSELGEATSASQGSIGQEDLAERPLLRVGEVMETIPGMIATEHSGGGKANQYFLRGFDLDHGTDFATTVDDIPINLRTHAHGQGYTDLNFLIPELVERIDYRKGPYDAQDGDFDSAGAATISYRDVLPGNYASLTGGSFEFERALVMGSPAVGDTHVLYALALEHANGPWDNPEDTRKGSGVLRWSGGGEMAVWHLTASAYAGRWNGTDQVPERAIREGLIDTYGTLNPTDGGHSSRYALAGDLQLGPPDERTTIRAYVFSYALNLWSDFTFDLRDPIHGDQIEQVDRRTVFGGSVIRTLSTPIAGVRSLTTLALEERSDLIPRVALYDTEDRSVLSTVSDDAVHEHSVDGWWQEATTWSPWLRSTVALRGDLYDMQVAASTPADTGDRVAGILSPKATLVVGPWERTEYYLNAGLGFHSNDARGVTETEDPQTGAPLGSAPALVRSKGLEVGVRTDALENAHATLGCFLLDLAHELIFDGDTGTTDSSDARTRRFGVELSTFDHPVPWLRLDADFCATRARFTEEVPAEGGGFGNHIPDSIPYVLQVGAEVDLTMGFYDECRLRYLGHRPLNESDSVQSGVAIELNDRIGWRQGLWEVHVDLLNVLNRRDADQSYYYQTQLPGESAPVEDVLVHPEEPFEVRAEVSYIFE